MTCPHAICSPKVSTSTAHEHDAEVDLFLSASVAPKANSPTAPSRRKEIRLRITLTSRIETLD
jgi:hypothetical protein